MWFVLRVLVLGLWLGAMTAFAFLFAPTAFARIGPTPAFAETIAATLHLLTRTGDWLGIAAVAITIFVRLESRRAAAGIVGCIAAAIALGFYEIGRIVPLMESTPLLTSAYETLHHTSSTIYSIVLLLVLVSFILSARAPER